MPYPNRPPPVTVLIYTRWREFLISRGSFSLFSSSSSVIARGPTYDEAEPPFGPLSHPMQTIWHVVSDTLG